MRAIVMHEPGAPEVLRLEEVPMPTAEAGRVLIRTEAIGAGYADTLIRSGAFPVPLPLVFGFEAAGTVVETGEGVDSGLVGTRVLMTNVSGSAGAYAEYVAAPLETITPIPDQLTAIDAVAVGASGAVALSLLRAANLTGSENVLIEVAAGSVGGYLTQLAREHGAGRIIATAGSPAKRAYAGKLGADVVLDHTDPGWTSQVGDAIDGKGLDVDFESIGGASAHQLLDTLTPGTGRILLYGFLAGEPSITPMDLLQRGLTLVGCGGMSAWAGRVQAARADALHLAAEGRLRPQVDTVLPLADAAEAHQRIQDRAAIGKVVLVP